MSEQAEIVEVVITPTSIPLTEGSTKGNVNPQPTVPRPEFTPAGVGLPPPNNPPATELPAAQPAPANPEPSR